MYKLANIDTFWIMTSFSRMSQCHFQSWVVRDDWKLLVSILDAVKLSLVLWHVHVCACFLNELVQQLSWKSICTVSDTAYGLRFFECHAGTHTHTYIRNTHTYIKIPFPFIFGFGYFPYPHPHTHPRIWIPRFWASSVDYGTYRIGYQRRIGRAYASVQSCQSLRCSLTWMMEVTNPTGWLRMRV